MMTPRMKNAGAKGTLGLLCSTPLGGKPIGAPSKKKLTAIRTMPNATIINAVLPRRLRTSLVLLLKMHDGEDLCEDPEEDGPQAE